LYELPPKLEQKLIVEMTEEQKDAYYEYLGTAKNFINDEINSKGFNRSHIHILSVLTRLRQLCCHPSVVISDYTGDSGKLLVLDNIIEESILNNHRILIFSQFVSVLKILKTRLTENNVNCLYLDGSTKSQERMRLVDAFNSGEGNVFLISLKAGGFGLNLTGADVVIHFDPWWNPAVEEQATDRAHRIGQTKNVEVIKLITKGSIEEKITKLHERKKNIADSIISGKDNEDSFITKLTREEIEDLFSL
jgi:SNF2 family DNA or RNA helicase